MKTSIYRDEKVKKLKQEAMVLYQQGLSMRRVGELLGRSHQWVALALNEAKNLSTAKGLT